MSKFLNSINTRTLVLLLFMALVAAARVLASGTGGQISSLSHYTPIGAMALFGGAYFSKYTKYLFPLLTLWISDLLLNRLVFYGEWRLFYEGFYWVYGAFALMVLVGQKLLRHFSFSRFLLAAFTIVLIHWLVTDIGMWLGGSMYPKTAAGLWSCLVAAIPFERNFLFGTLFYGVLMFGVFEWLKARSPRLRMSYNRNELC
ncbi:DUF6580 family putative transport protein [Pontibacter rugosus]|uniref:DUF6580 family putative transport protein n=1 Tax=Pontibacter rugosus TaxID=1745966 RepID=A0ABW3SSH5_9BACT